MNKVRICLDAGHIGSRYNQSPVVKTYYESAMVWSLHLKLKAALEARGFEVMTTRVSIDTDLGVYERGAASKACDAFISLHSNACGTESVDYPVVYRAYDNLNDSDTIALNIAKKTAASSSREQAVSFGSGFLLRQKAAICWAVAWASPMIAVFSSSLAVTP